MTRNSEHVGRYTVDWIVRRGRDQSTRWQKTKGNVIRDAVEATFESRTVNDKSCPVKIEGMICLRPSLIRAGGEGLWETQDPRIGIGRVSSVCLSVWLAGWLLFSAITRKSECDEAMVVNFR